MCIMIHECPIAVIRDTNAIWELVEVFGSGILSRNENKLHIPYTSQLSSEKFESTNNENSKILANIII